MTLLPNEWSTSVGLFLSAALVSTWRTTFAMQKRKRNIIRRKYSGATISKQREGVYDVLIVGAGPAGATAAYYLGLQGKKVALCDKKKFPRAKPCGDAWCAPALRILEEMGILQQMEKDGIAYPVKRGGLISPFGYRCINTAGEKYGAVTGCKTYAIKRQLADKYIVDAANAHASVSLLEVEIDTATLDPQSLLWTVTTKSSSPISTTSTLTTKMLLVCDGSTSYLGQKLGLVPKGSQPEAQCSHAYVKRGTHQWTEADGVMIFNKSVLPGYSALFRHYNDDVYLGTYILPGGKATSRAIAPFEAEAVVQHPYIRQSIGNADGEDNMIWEEKRIVAPIRCGGIKHPGRSYGLQVLLVGDAAGHVDPLTGEGIHTAMIAGKIAAEVCQEMFATGNFSMNAGEAYSLRCYDAFGYEFWSSTLCARIIHAMPIAIDAVAVVGARRGQAFLDFFGECMTGVRPKSDFAEPLLLLEIGLELIRQIVLQYVIRIEPMVPQDIGQAAVDKQAVAAAAAAAATKGKQR